MWRSGLRVHSAADVAIAGIAVAAIVLAAYEIFQSGLYKPSIVAGGQVEYTDKHGYRVKAATRQVAVGRRLFWQVELSPGVWADCGGDCAGVLRRGSE